MTVTREAIAVPDSTGPTISLLRELRRDRARQRAANAAYWIYLVVLTVALYGGSRIAATAHDVRHPPLPSAQTPHVLHAAPYGLTALALLLLLVLVRDALWRGPVTLQQPAVDWLLDTPVDRGRLLRPGSGCRRRSPPWPARPSASSRPLPWSASGSAATASATCCA